MKACSKAVQEVFIKLYEKGYIYKGSRIINWCPVCQTSISDAEVEHEDQDGFFWHINYPVVGEEGKFVEIATTRPETLLGDTAVAVNPDDDRYKDIVGKMLKLPSQTERSRLLPMSMLTRNSEQAALRSHRHMILTISRLERDTIFQK